MRCPFCAHEDSQVKDSRPSEDGAAIRRRRQCEACGQRFTTFERVQLRDLTVVKKDGKREPFDRDKLARAIGHATRKRDIDADKIEVVMGDSDRSPRGLTGGSRALPVGGSALHEAAKKIIEKGKQIAAHLLEASAVDIEFGAVIRR